MTADVPRTWPRNSLDGSSPPTPACPDLEAHDALGGRNIKWKISVSERVPEGPEYQKS